MQTTSHKHLSFFTDSTIALNMYTGIILRLVYVLHAKIELFHYDINHIRT